MELITPAVSDTSAQIQNLENLACAPSITYQPPVGSFLSDFCASATLALGTATSPCTSAHVPALVPYGALSDALCQQLYAWISSGGTGTPNACQVIATP